MRISARTRIAGVMGSPVDHSLSPLLHNAAYEATGFDGVYVALPVEPGQIKLAVRGLRALGFIGANVTVPFKREVLGLCDRLDRLAEAVGAVNTLVRGSDGLITGFNTDVGGFADALAEFAPDLMESGGRALVLGSGGAARSVVAALQGRFTISAVARRTEDALGLLDLGATEVLLWTEEALARLVGEAVLLVDATSASLSEDGERALPERVPVELMPKRALACSLVYHREPRLLTEAKASGVRVMDGGNMLIHQAARAFTLMTNIPAPVPAMRAAFLAAR
ncbi:MAG: shikimate dehydrogenase [Deltaproteobacteria bacterium]|nr:shikimate dehydrogenase [Deltaproteobacteria bacterium]